MVCKARDRRPGDLAAGGDDQPVVRQDIPALRRRYPDLAPVQVNVGYVPHDMADADRIEHGIQCDPDIAQVGFVVAHPDRVEGIAVDQGDFEVRGRDSKFTAPTCGTDGAPEPGETAADNYDALHAAALHCPQ